MSRRRLLRRRSPLGEKQYPSSTGIAASHRATKRCVVRLGCVAAQMINRSLGPLQIFYPTISPLAASRSIRLRASHPVVRPAVKMTIWCAIRVGFRLVFWSALFLLISNSPAEISVKIEPMNMSSPIRFSRRCWLSLAISGFTRAQLIAKEARLSITMKLLAGTTSVAPVKSRPCRTMALISSKAKITLHASTEISRSQVT
jgi:hypothetical protein